MNNIILFCVFLVFAEGGFGDTIPVKVGDSVTLNTGLSEIQNNDLIEWRFGEDLIARVRKNTDPIIYDGNFKDRLELDRQTGSLTIKNTKTTDTGEYKVSNSINTFKKSFNVNVSESGSGADSGLSGGAIAGIVIGVVLVVCAIAVGIYFGVKKNQDMI